MARTLDVGLRAAWEQRLGRLEQWTGTVKQFCAQERVSVASLYQWRRKLHGNHSHQSNGSSADARGPRRRQRTSSHTSPTSAAFMPVQVVGSAVVEVVLGHLLIGGVEPLFVILARGHRET